MNSCRNELSLHLVWYTFIPFLVVLSMEVCNLMLVSKSNLQEVERRFKDALPGHKLAVSFVKSSISLAVPDNGVIVNGWKITSITSKSVN